MKQIIHMNKTLYTQMFSCTYLGYVNTTQAPARGWRRTRVSSALGVPCNLTKINRQSNSVGLNAVPHRKISCILPIAPSKQLAPFRSSRRQQAVSHNSRGSHRLTSSTLEPRRWSHSCKQVSAEGQPSPYALLSFGDQKPSAMVGSRSQSLPSYQFQSLDTRLDS